VYAVAELQVIRLCKLRITVSVKYVNSIAEQRTVSVHRGYILETFHVTETAVCKVKTI
jgi:hypothetical protein